MPVGARLDYMRIPPAEKFVCNFTSMEPCANGAALHHLEQSTKGTFTNREGRFLSDGGISTERHYDVLNSVWSRLTFGGSKPPPLTKESRWKRTGQEEDLHRQRLFRKAMKGDCKLPVDETRPRENFWLLTLTPFRDNS